MSKRDDRFPASTVRRRSSWTRRHCRDIFRRHDIPPTRHRPAQQRDPSERRRDDRYHARRDVSTPSTTIDLSSSSLNTEAYPFTTTSASHDANLTIMEIIELATTSSASQTRELVLPKINGPLPPGVVTNSSDSTPASIDVSTSTTEITSTSTSDQEESGTTLTESERSSATSRGVENWSSSEVVVSTSSESASPLPASGPVSQIASITSALVGPVLPSISLGLPTSASVSPGLQPPSVLSVTLHASLGIPNITSAIPSILSSELSRLTGGVISIPTHPITLNVTTLLSSLPTVPTLPSSIPFPNLTTITPLTSQSKVNATVAATPTSTLRNLTTITTSTFAGTFTGSTTTAPRNGTTLTTITTVPQTNLSTVVPFNRTSTTLPPAIIPTNLTLTFTVFPTGSVNLTTISSRTTATFISTTESSNSITSSTSLISFTSSSNFLSSIGSVTVSSGGTGQSSLSATSVSKSSFSSSSEFSVTVFQPSATFTPGSGGPGTIFPTSSTISTPSSNPSNVVPLVPAIVGSIGGVVLLAALGMLLFLYRRKLGLSRLESGPAYAGGSQGESQLMTERGFTVLSGQRLDTGVSGGTPIVYRQPGAQTRDTRGRSVSTTQSRFTEHL